MDIQKGIVGILNPDGRIIGTGFFVTETAILTCAHVIKEAESEPGGMVQIRFASDKSETVAAVHLSSWSPVDEHDIALLHIEHMPNDTEHLSLGSSSGTSGHIFRTYGFATVSSVQGLGARGVIIDVVEGGDLLQITSQEIDRGFSGAPIVDEARGVAVGMITWGKISTSTQRHRDTTFAVTTEAIKKSCQELEFSDICPYLGLESFTEDTASYFFGREALTKKLLGVLLSGRRFLAVFGPSGSGKSSVVRAGLLPALKKGQLPDSEKWAQVTIRPADSIFEQMKTVDFDLSDINGYLDSHTGSERIVLFIDQFEELFTLCPDEIRELAVNDLAIALGDSRFFLIVSMRDEFYSIFHAKAASLAESEHLQVENVPGYLKREELLAMIEKPIKKVGLKLEDGLVELILVDLMRDGEAPSSTLPLLEFALTQLWRNRHDGRLIHEAYEKIGGVTGSLARWADDTYSELSNEEQILARSLLTSLVHLGNEAQGLPDTRKRRKLTELELSDSAQVVVKQFTDRRLIATSGDIAELIHDSLVREWDRLKTWIESDRENLRLSEGVSDAARQWEIGKRDENLLNHRGARLELVLALSVESRYPLSNLEREYLNACENLRDKEKAATDRRRKIAISSTVTVLIVIISILFGWAITSRNNASKLAYQIATATYAQGIAQQQAATADSAKATAVSEASVRATAQANAELQAEISHAGELAAQAVTLSEKNPTLSALLSIEAYRLADTIATRSTLSNIAEAILQKRRFLRGPRKPIQSMAISQDGQFVASGESDRIARVWNIESGKEIINMTHKNVVTAIAISPDNNFIASTSYDNQVHVWRVSTGKELLLLNHDDWITSIAFSPDGNFLISGSQDNTVRVWDTKSRREIAQFELPAWVSTIAISPDGKYIAAGDITGLIYIWEVTTRNETRINLHDDLVTSIAFSPDGNFIASGSKDNTVRVWSLSAGKEIAHMAHDDSVLSVAFSPDNKYVVSGGQDNTSRIWESKTGLEVLRNVDDDSIIFVSFIPNSKYILSGNSRGFFRFWHWNLEDLISDICASSFLSYNLTINEWEQYIGENYPYQKTCPNLGMQPEPTATP